MSSRIRETVGQLVDERYKLLRLMGEGGMGRVYEAEHVGIGKQVAVKILHAAFSNVADLVARFRQEARIATQIGNAHIVDVTDSGTTEDGRFYFVMEYLDGVELHAALQDGPLELGRALHITRQLAEALGAAHEHGVIHRDLKPENILLVERDGDPDFVKVLDFGIAKTMDADRSERKLTQPGLAMGTPEYVAPEQALALTTDARSDIYSLGAIFYELVTGAQPYRADTFTQVLVLKSTTEPQPPRELRSDLPVEVQEIILKAMAREPADRYQTMGEMAAVIASFVESRPAAHAAEALTAPVRVPTAPEPEPELAIVEAEGPPVAARAPARYSVPPPAPQRGMGRWIVAACLVVAAGGGAFWFFTRGGADDETTAQPAAARPIADEVAAPAPAADAAPVAAAAVAAAPDAAPVAADAAPAPEPPKARAARTLKEARAFIAKAAKAAARKDWAAARDLFDRVARGRHMSEAGRLGLARVELADEHPDLAIDHATIALRDGAGTAARHVLARALVAAGRKPDAIKQYRLLLKEEPKNRAAQQELAALAKPPPKKKKRSR